jgi:hypothetical protein
LENEFDIFFSLRLLFCNPKPKPMSVFSGPRICPACGKKGRILPVNKTATNPFLRKYHCQSCHWQGLMFRAVKNQSRPGFYLSMGAIAGLLLLLVAALYKLLQMLPEQ